MAPCTRCNGSGTEPSALDEAARDLAALISSAEMSEDTRDALSQAAARLNAVACARLSQREALLDEILRAIGEPGDGKPGPWSHWMVQLPAGDVRSWRERRQS
jgi:hypothetical protein